MLSITFSQKFLSVWILPVPRVVTKQLTDHVEEATSYLKQLLGPDYHFSDQPVFESLWHNMSACHHVDDEGILHFYAAPRYAEPQVRFSGDILYWKDKNDSNIWLDSLGQRWRGERDLHQCSIRGNRSSLSSGTIMERTRLWWVSIMLAVLSCLKGVSTPETSYYV